MADHLSTLQVKQLCVSALPDDELAAAAVHTSECPSCHRRFVEELRRQRGSARFNLTLEPEFWFRNDHVAFEQLVALADQTVDQETEEIINIHLKTCGTCREDIRSFLAFRETTNREMDISYGPTHYASTGRPSASWWQGLQWRPVYAVAAMVLVAIAMLIGIVALNGRSTHVDADKNGQINAGNESAIVSSSPAPEVIPRPRSVEDSVEIATLRDGAGEVRIDKNGRVTGLDQVPEKSRQYIARVALSERIEPAEVLRRLSGEQSGLRGNENGRQGFRLLYPVRRVVTDDRPTFRWESLPGVSSYRVYVLDSNGKQVAQSEELPPNQIQWKSQTRLRRGQIFSWVVTALVDGKKIVSPSVEDPEMKFAVLSAADSQELTRLKKSNSYLALGVFYARTGLLNEAEREFQKLSKLNPHSELPRKLLQDVRGIRQKNN